MRGAIASGAAFACLTVGACSADRAAEQDPSTVFSTPTTTQPRDVIAQDQAFKAIREAVKKFEDEASTVVGAHGYSADTCVAWPSRTPGEYIVQKNPVAISNTTDKSSTSVFLFPFSNAPGNEYGDGPFQHIPLKPDGKADTEHILSDMTGMTIQSASPHFVEVTGLKGVDTDGLRAWITGADDKRYAETARINAQNAVSTMVELCGEDFRYRAGQRTDFQIPKN